MLTIIMLVLKLFRSRIHSWIQHFASCCHFCTFLYDHCIMYRIVGILSPCKYTVILTKYCWCCYIITIIYGKIFNDQKPCISLICFFNFFFYEISNTRNMPKNYLFRLQTIKIESSARPKIGIIRIFQIRKRSEAFSTACCGTHLFPVLGF